MAKSILEARDNVSQQDKQDALRVAVKKNDLLAISCLLTEGIKPTSDDFLDALKKASYPILELFLNDGYNINSQLRDDYPPPLADAIFDPELVRWLVQHGANPNARCKFDITALSLAAMHGSYEVVDLLFELGASVAYGQPLFYAVRYNRSEDIIELFLQKGALINNIMFQDHDVSFHHFRSLGLGTVLHEAARQRNRQLFEFLLQNGADPNIKNTLGNVPSLPILNAAL